MITHGLDIHLVKLVDELVAVLGTSGTISRFAS